MWNSWRYRPNHLSEIHATGIAYFVLDKLGDKVAGPFANKGDARVFLMSLSEGEFQIAHEYWGPSLDPVAHADGQLDFSEGPLAKFLSKLIRRRADLRTYCASLWENLDKQHTH